MKRTNPSNVLLAQKGHMLVYTAALQCMKVKRLSIVLFVMPCMQETNKCKIILQNMKSVHEKGNSNVVKCVMKAFILRII